MISPDITLKLMTKCPIEVNGVKILHKPIVTIAEIGYMTYSMYLTLLTANPADMVENEDIGETTQLDMLYAVYLQGGDLKDVIEKSFEYFCGSIPEALTDEVGFSIGEGKLTNDNYDAFKSILKMRTATYSAEEDEKAKPMNDKAREILAKRDAARKKLAKEKKDKGGGSLSLSDLISILAGGLKMSIHDIVENYDMYQFTDQMNRLKIFQDYDVNIQALLHGAKSEDIDLVPWSAKSSLLESDNDSD